MKLHEVKSLPTWEEMIKDEPLTVEELAEWCQAHFNENAALGKQTYRPDHFEEVSPGIFDAKVRIDIIMHDDDELPVKFRTAHQGFKMEGGKSLKGCPQVVVGMFHLVGNASFEGAPKIVGGLIFDKRDSLKDIHKHFKTTYGMVRFSRRITKDVLGVILLDYEKVDDRKVSVWGTPNGGVAHTKVINILNEHAGKGKAGVLAAQAELEDADLEDYANL